jgi:hypothetical protein
MVPAGDDLHEFSLRQTVAHRMSERFTWLRRMMQRSSALPQLERLHTSRMAKPALERASLMQRLIQAPPPAPGVQLSSFWQSD